MELIKVSDIATSLKAIQEDVIQGNVDALEVYCITNEAEKALKGVNSVIKGYAKDEASKYGAKTFKAFNKEVTIKNGSARPDFTEDHVYNQLKGQLKEREALLKAALKSSTPIYDSEGVEVPKVTVKYTDDSIIIK